MVKCEICGISADCYAFKLRLDGTQSPSPSFRCRNHLNTDTNISESQHKALNPGFLNKLSENFLCSNTLVLSHDNIYIVSGCTTRRNIIQIYNLLTGALEPSLHNESAFTIRNIVFSKDDCLLVSCADDGLIEV